MARLFKLELFKLNVTIVVPRFSFLLGWVELFKGVRITLKSWLLVSAMIAVGAFVINVYLCSRLTI
jgi:hypothetical protein